MPRCRILLPFLFLAGSILGPSAGFSGESAPTAAASTAIEALRRLKGMDLDTNPAVKSVLLRVLDSSRGTASFVEWVRDFQLTGQEEGLIEVATKLPQDPAAAEALRLVQMTAGLEPIRAAVRRDPTTRAALVEACANSGEAGLHPLLLAVLTDGEAPVPVRATALRGLVRTESGARELLKIAREGRLDEHLRNTGALALAQTRWPAVRAEAAEVLPLPKAADGDALPPLSDLVRLRGDAGRGAKVFRSEQAACIKCHRIESEGIDFGPALSQIGTKLARQALFESILDPSAGISFGFEGWTVETRGGEEITGLIASETGEELAIRQQTGVVVRVKKSDIRRRDPQKLSVMPGGLGQILRRQELVDLVEYLTTLKVK